MMKASIKITKEQKEILKHASRHSLYRGGGPDMDALCDQGMMEFAGRPSPVPDPCYRITAVGKKVLEANG
jgi:hypothetical protein